jgi:hypothetical protein
VSTETVVDLEFRAGLARHVRESLRHCYNWLSRDGHTFEFVVARHPDEVRNASRRFLQLHSQRDCMPWGPRHADRFAGHSLRAFLFGVCDRLGARDAVRVFQLRIAAPRLRRVSGSPLRTQRTAAAAETAAAVPPLELIYRKRLTVPGATGGAAARRAFAAGPRQIGVTLVSLPC